MEKNYKFERTILNIRWVDYQRIRAVFPALRNESAQAYFRRFALWLQVNSKYFKVNSRGTVTDYKTDVFGVEK